MIDKRNIAIERMIITSPGKSQKVEGDEMAVQNVKELTVYKKAYRQAMRFFEISKRFPLE